MIPRKMEVAFTIKDGLIRVVRDEAGWWWAELGEKTIKLDRRAAFLYLLPLLEEPPRTIMAESATPFPLEELVLFALHSASAYWKDLALTWVESNDIWSDEVDEEIGRLAAKESRWPQRLRHRAAKLRRKRGLAT